MLLIEKIDLYKNDKQRRLFIYEGSSFDKKDNPLVIFGFDAHNLFGPSYSSFGTSWKVNDVLEQMGIKNYLVFGVQCEEGMKRVAEYSPVPYSKGLKLWGSLSENPYGVKHVEAINDVLIPYIESKYDFKLSDTQSLMMGSSCGGVMSTYYSAIFPHRFSSYLAMSPAYWANAPYIHDLVANSNYDAKIYIDMGGKESTGDAAGSCDYIKNYKAMKEILKNKNVKWGFFPEHKHSEIYWNKRLPEALKWLLASDERNL